MGPAIHFIFYLAIISELAPVVAAYATRRRLDRSLKILFAYLTLSFVTDVGLVLMARNSINNLWVISLFAPLEFGMLMTVFACWQKENTARKLMFWSVPLFVCLTLFESFTWGGSSDFKAISKAISAVGLVVVSSVALARLRLLELSHLTNEPQMWVSLAVLLHFGVATLVYAASGNLLSISRDLAMIPWAAKASANIVSCLLFTKGFLCCRTR